MTRSENKKDKINILSTKRANLLPIRNVVIFPNIVQPLTVGREKSVNAIEEALKKDRYIVVATQKNEQIDNPNPEDIYDVGVLAEILQVIKLPDGTLRAIIEGLNRVRILHYIKREGIFEVEVELYVPSVEITPYINALSRKVIDLFEQYYQLNKRLSPENYIDLINIKDPNKLSDLVSSSIIINIEEKQEILSLFNIEERLKKLIEILKREIEVLELQGKIETEIKNKFDKTQKDFYLREQLKAIQRELGDIEGEEYSEEAATYKNKIDSINLPEEVKKIVDEELKRLAKMPPMMAEAGVVRNYLDWILALPWDKETVDQLDLVKAKKILDEDHYGLKDVKERILEYLAVRKLSKNVKSPILCLIGPPGVGKTSLGKSIARAMGRNFVRVSLGGIRDEAEIRGHRRTYVGALPGRIIQGIKQTQTKNPVFLLDEIDKIGIDFRGDPASALLEALDPEQNSAFSDHYLEVPFDLSKVFFITTGNVVHTIPPALRDRMEIITIPGYTVEEKIEIAKGFLIPKQLEANGLKTSDIEITDDALYKLIQDYTLEAGVRELERKIAKIFRKVALKKAESEFKFKKIVVTPKNIFDFLKIPVFRHEVAGKKNDPGVVTGLSITEYGGEIIFIESTKMAGKGNLILTGQLGDVMKESASAALSYIRSNAAKFSLDPKFYENIDIHIHVPEGAIPKDGPSAGVAICTSLFSLLLNKQIPADIAMTGEITLQGRIIPIGGLKDKLLAAQRAGVKVVIIPKENDKDLTEVPQNILKELKIEEVSDFSEVYKMLFLEKK